MDGIIYCYWYYNEDCRIITIQASKQPEGQGAWLYSEYDREKKRWFTPRPPMITSEELAEMTCLGFGHAPPRHDLPVLLAMRPRFPL